MHNITNLLPPLSVDTATGQDKLGNIFVQKQCAIFIDSLFGKTNTSTHLLKRQLKLII